MKRLLIIGSEGYVGPSVVDIFNNKQYIITCFDSNWFAGSKLNFMNDLNNVSRIYGDVRTGVFSILNNNNFDIVIYLAAVSNDPIGHIFSSPTHEINTRSALNIALECKNSGVKQFLYASSCSVYGNGNGAAPVSELSPVNPLTDYSVSKYNAEKGLEVLVSNDFKVGCLRFATAAGPSINMRYDLVVNDFVLSALKFGEILIKSNGKPWRPIINTIDMAYGFFHISNALKTSEENFLTVNVGFNEWNFTVEEIAANVKAVIGEKVLVNMDENAPDDKRSYRVNFDKYESIAITKVFPAMSFMEMITKVSVFSEKIIALNSLDMYPELLMKRHSALNRHIELGKMDANLIWLNN